MKRIGLFGGTFNPIHIGHLRSMIEVKESFSLDKVILIPSATPPHKETSNLAPAADRLEMIRLSAAHLSEVSVSDVESNRSGPSYTIETIQYFRSLCDPKDRLFMLIGSDAFLELHTWKSYMDLVKSISFITMHRPGQEEIESTVGAYLTRSIFSDYRFDPQKDLFESRQTKETVRICRITQIDISSTRIRQLVAANRSIRFLVTEAVCNYIIHSGLYRQ